MTIGKNIKKYRKAAGLKQWELAERIGVSEYAIYHYEVGACSLPIDLLKPMAKALGVTVEAILEEEEGC